MMPPVVEQLWLDGERIPFQVRVIQRTDAPNEFDLDSFMCQLLPVAYAYGDLSR